MNDTYVVWAKLQKVRMCIYISPMTRYILTIKYLVKIILEIQTKLIIAKNEIKTED